MHRIFIEKKPAFAAEARHLLHDLRESLSLPELEAVRLLQRYDVVGVSDDEFRDAVGHILSEPQIDTATPEFSLAEDERAFAVEYLPGQFYQRADSAAQCIQILTGKEKPVVSSARVIVLRGSLSDAELARVKDYLINKVDSHEVPVSAAPAQQVAHTPADVAILDGFADADPAALRASLSLAMSAEDVAFCQGYFRDEEKRDPSITEIRMLDTYWSDHCRHTTFLTSISDVRFGEGTGPVQRAWQTYRDVREMLGRGDRPVTLMDIALAGMRELRASGELDNLEESDEINAASIVVPVSIDGRPEEEWLVMFKNETHNHPTEIEPFGGAATCLGGCIRDPLSGRSYVYQAMRVTGAADPLVPFSETLPGKLPQKKICQIAAKGYSSYGNQIGLATGQVAEVYHPGYVAKRMEIGAVVAAAPRANVFRGKPADGDAILLIGGRTGRDGIGGATGSSKEHTDTALENSAEVQKGDAPTERKIQRLFRNAELARKIKVCNDFGAGGVSVAIGEIAPSLDIDLDAVPKKYEGLDGTEIAISESQERMAVCIDPADICFFIAESDKENLECVHVATVRDHGRLRMTWRGKRIVDLSRAFLDTNGVQQTATIEVSSGTAASGGLTSILHSSHEQRTDLLERCPQGILRESLGTAGEAIAEVLGRVHQAGEKSGVPSPATAGERHELHRALRSLEERELRSRLSGSFANGGEFETKWRERGSLGGAEQKVFPDGEGRYLKANNGCYHGHWQQFLDRLHYHRILFPDTAYIIEGLAEIGGELTFLLSQPEAHAFIDDEGNHLGASREQVEDFMKSIGAFRFRNDDYYLPSEDLFIEDLHDENVLLGTDGETLRFIDPVIYRRPADLPVPKPLPKSIRRFADHLRELNHASQKGLGEMFDGSVGAGTVLWPFGGAHQLTPPDAMVAKLPVLDGDTDTASFMSWAYNPELSSASPFHGAAWAVTESALKCVSAGARLADVRLTLQEYFPKLGNDPKRWALPFTALLGAFDAQHHLRLAAIGGKDSMSGSFNDLDVPPTLVSFALAPGKASLAISPEFKAAGNKVSLVEIPATSEGLPDYPRIKQIAAAIADANEAGLVVSAKLAGHPGIAHAIAIACFGNMLGFRQTSGGRDDLLATAPSTFLIEHNAPLPAELGAVEFGVVTEEPNLRLHGEGLEVFRADLATLSAVWRGKLEGVYPTSPDFMDRSVPVALETDNGIFQIRNRTSAIAHPKVLIPAFPGTNSEYDSAKAFREAGAETEILVFRNLTPSHIEESLASLAEKIRGSQILFIPGGFSAGDEPDGSAKFIATVLRNPRVADAVMDLLNNRDGLVLGICNGFQALIKTGLVPYGEIRESTADSPTLFHNEIGRHVSCYVHTRVANVMSPWLANNKVGDIHVLPVSHGEGRFVAPPAFIAELAAKGQIATQYCGPDGTPTMDIAHNPNGSMAAVEGITSPCGRVFGKMAHTERRGKHVAKNIPGNKIQPIFEAGVRYFS